MPPAANAAIVALDVTNALGAVTTDAQTIFDVVLPIVGTILGLVIGLKLLKKFAAKI